MCGIFKSNTQKEFDRLYEANLVRGSRSFGGLFIKEDRTSIFKTDNILFNAPTMNADIYLGHLRAPTGDSRLFSDVNSHPFSYGDWIVAHNGIISNFDRLRHMYSVQCEVDSNIIPFLLDCKGFSSFEFLQGTWACWMFNIKTRELFVTRKDNTLFVNRSNGDFSSFRIDDHFEALEKNKVFKVTNDKYEEVHSYKAKPTYFTP